MEIREEGLLEIVDRTLGHACTLVCRYCAAGIPVRPDPEPHRAMLLWHPDVTGAVRGHQCGAALIRHADPKQILELIRKEMSAGGRPPSS